MARRGGRQGVGRGAWGAAAILIAFALVALVERGLERTLPEDGLARAVAAQASGVVVESEGVVVSVLPDDRRGSRHQRFLLEVASGGTVLVAHNIDLAPRVAGLARGDVVRFRGEYEWNDKGGVVHWTHHDPDGRRPGGWVELAGRRYR